MTACASRCSSACLLRRIIIVKKMRGRAVVPLDKSGHISRRIFARPFHLPADPWLGDGARGERLSHWRTDNIAAHVDIVPVPTAAGFAGKSAETTDAIASTNENIIYLVVIRYREGVL